MTTTKQLAKNGDYQLTHKYSHMFCTLTSTTLTSDTTIHNKLRIQEQAYTNTTTNNNNLIKRHNRCKNVQIKLH